MSLRPPSRYTTDAGGAGASTNSGFSALDHELAGEKAAALGRAGERVEKALRALVDTPVESPHRSSAMKAAADAVYAYFIQRELCGLRRHQDAIAQYAIPGEVLARLGAS